MPRRLPVRPAKLIGNLFVLFVLMIISLLYYVYVIVLWGPRAVSKYLHTPITQSPSIDSILVMVLLAFFHVLFVFLIWSFF